MILLAMMFATLPTPVFGALYPKGILDRPASQAFCSTRYKFSTNDSIDQVALFYSRQATAAHVTMLDDTAAKFADYRMLVFAREPKFLNVIISRKGGLTTVRVAFHVDTKASC